MWGEESRARKVGSKKVVPKKSGTRKKGEESGAIKVGREKWDDKSGARKVG